MFQETTRWGILHLLLSLTLLASGGQGQGQGSSTCLSSSSSQPPNVEVLLNQTTTTPGADNATTTTTPTLFSLLLLNCSAHYPIHWTFLHHPHKLQEEESESHGSPSSLGESPPSSISFSWNVSHIRMKEDILDESGPELWVALLTFVNVSMSRLQDFISPTCTSVGGELCLQTGIPGLSLEQEGGPNRKLDSPGGVEGGKRKNCSLDLWFNQASGHFLCKNKEGAVGGGGGGSTISGNYSSSSPPPPTPGMSFRYCANPTECGVSSWDECWEHGGHQHPKACNTGDKTGNCASLSVASEFPIPKVISCYVPKNKGQQGGGDGGGGSSHGGVQLLGYFHSLKELQGHPASSYVSWEEADPSDLVSITPTKSLLLGNESFGLECSASSYYFSAGLHLTIKSLSASSSSYSERELTRQMDTQENLEMWTATRSTSSGSGSTSPSGGQQSRKMPEMPLRRTILARNLVLPPGDYELSCYAPVWNSSAWTVKSALVSVSRLSLPTFVSGNATTTIPFAPRHNISCLARGIPPPKLTWSYRSDRVQVEEVGGESTQMSWSLLTLPPNLEASATEIEFKCRAENAAGFAEKLFLVTRNDESFLVSTKIAATVVLLGFVGNLIVFFFCWKKLFAESDDEEDEERKELAGIKFLRQLWNGHVSGCGWRRRSCKNKTKNKNRNKEGGVGGGDESCTHPKCRQKQTQTV